MGDLVQRLRGEYRIPIADGLGATGGGEEPDNPTEFVRRFQTTPIMHEAADRIEALTAECDALRARVAELEAENVRLRARSYTLAVAIMGGEDAPGYADSIPAEVLAEDIRKERRDRDAWTDTAVRAALTATLGGKE